MTNRRNRRRSAQAKQPIPQAPMPYYAPIPVPSPPHAEPTPVATVRLLQDKNASVARVDLSKLNWTDNDGYHPPATEYSFVASGSTKREQGDRFDPRTGEMLALGRAFQRLSRQLLAEGNRRVREMTKIQQQEAEDRVAKKERVAKPVHRRTREEWEALQHQEYVNDLTALAQALGLQISEDATVGNYGVVASVPDLTNDDLINMEREVAAERLAKLEEKYYRSDAIVLSGNRYLYSDNGYLMLYNGDDNTSTQLAKL